MLAATVLGVFFIPVLYFSIQSLTNRLSGKKAAPTPPPLVPEEHFPEPKGIAAQGD